LPITAPASPAPPPVRACVYCGSRAGQLPAYAEAATQLGHAIGRRGGQLVYGGGRVGLMGVVAEATLAAGGTVVGVITQALMQREVGHRGLTELHVVQTMHERKQMMAERADLFIALPGGIGTMEELFEVWTWRQLGYHDKPIGLLDVQGYYRDFMRLCGGMVEQGFLLAEQLQVLDTDDDADRLLGRLIGRARGLTGPGDYSRI